MFIVIGALIIAAGIFLVVKTDWFLSNFGPITWFESKLSSDGGSRLGYKLIGIIFLIIGIIVMTGSGDDFIRWILGPILKYNQSEI